MRREIEAVIDGLSPGEEGDDVELGFSSSTAAQHAGVAAKACGGQEEDTTADLEGSNQHQFSNKGLPSVRKCAWESNKPRTQVMYVGITAVRCNCGGQNCNQASTTQGRNGAKRNMTQGKP